MILPQVRSADKVVLESIVKDIGKIADVMQDESACGLKDSDSLRLTVAYKCFMNSSLEKRINGLTEICTMCAKYTPAANMPQFPQELEALVNWIVEKDLIGALFGTDSHLQLTQRSGDVLLALDRQDRLTDDHLGALWGSLESCNPSEQPQFLQAIVEMVDSFEACGHAQKYLYRRLLCTPGPALSVHHLVEGSGQLKGLFGTLHGQFLYQQGAANPQYGHASDLGSEWLDGLRWLWQVAAASPKSSAAASREVQQVALDLLVHRLGMCWEQTYPAHDEFVALAVQALASRQAMNAALGVLTAIINTFGKGKTTGHYTAPADPSSAWTAKVKLENDHGLVGSLVSYATSIAEQATKTEDSNAHMDAASEARKALDLLNLFLHCPFRHPHPRDGLGLSLSHMDLLWGAFAESLPGCSLDSGSMQIDDPPTHLTVRPMPLRSIFFSFVSASVQMETPQVTPAYPVATGPPLALSSSPFLEGVLEDLFSRKLKQFLSRHPLAVGMPEYKVLINLFKRCNLSAVSLKLTGFSKKTEELVLQAEDPDGLDSMWEVVMCAPDTDVGSHATADLTQLTQNVSPALRSRSVELFRKFTTRCLSALEQGCQQYCAGNATAGALRVRRSVGLLQAILGAFERRLPDECRLALEQARHGTAGGMVSGQMLKFTVSTVSSTVSHSLKMPASSTCLALRLQLTQIFHMETWQMRVVFAGKSLDTQYDDITLASLGLIDGAKVVVIKSQHSQTPDLYTEPPPEDEWPHYILSSDPEFSQLMEALAKAPGPEHQAQIWSLLQRVPTNSQLKSLITGLAGLDHGAIPPPRVQWREIFDTSNVFRLHYALQTVYMVLHGSQPSEDCQQSFADIFVRLGGMRKLVQILVSLRLPAGLDKSCPPSPWIPPTLSQTSSGPPPSPLGSPVGSPTAGQQAALTQETAWVDVLLLLCQILGWLGDLLDTCQSTLPDLLASQAGSKAAALAHLMDLCRQCGWPSGGRDDPAPAPAGIQAFEETLALLERCVYHGTAPDQETGWLEALLAYPDLGRWVSAMMLSCPDKQVRALTCEKFRQFCVAVPFSGPQAVSQGPVSEVSPSAPRMKPKYYRLVPHPGNPEPRVHTSITCRRLRGRSADEFEELEGDGGRPLCGFCTSQPGGPHQSAIDGIDVGNQLLVHLFGPLEMVEEYQDQAADYFALLSVAMPICLQNPSFASLPAVSTDLPLCLARILSTHPVLETGTNPVDADASAGVPAEDIIMIGSADLLAKLLPYTPDGLFQSGTKVSGAHPLSLVLLAYQHLFRLPTAQDHSSNPLPPTCKSQQARAAAFNLALSVCKRYPEETDVLLKHLTELHVSSASLDYKPVLVAGMERAAGGVGLKNLGATCYMNSFTQQLFANRLIRYCVVAAYSELGLPDAEESNAVTVLRNLGLLFSQLQETQMQFVDTKFFCNNYLDWEGQPMNSHLQMDVDEFLAAFLDKLEEAFKKTSLGDVVRECLGTTMLSKVVSQDCPHRSVRREDFLTIQLEVKGLPGVKESLDAVFAKEDLSGSNQYKCDQCNKHVNAKKGYELAKLSNTVILHLKRFSFDFDTMRKLKVNDEFTFPMQLDLSPYASSEPNEGLDGVESTPRPCSYYKFHLVGVVTHSGTADSGHYYSYIKDKDIFEEDSSGGKWMQFNDADVTPFDPEELPQMCFGGPTKTMAGMVTDKIYSGYLLVYDRDVPESLSDKVRIPVPLDSSVRRILPELGPGAAPNSPLTASHLLSTELYATIWQQNTDFLRQRTIFADDYFAFVKQVLELAISQHQVTAKQKALAPTANDKALGHAIKCAVYFFVNVLLRSHQKDEMIPFANEIVANLNTHTVQMVLLYAQSQDYNWMSVYMRNCSSITPRSAFALLITHCIAAACEADTNPDQQPMCGPMEQRLVHPLITWMLHQLQDADSEGKSSLATRNLECFFGLLRTYALLGPAQRHWLLCNGVISSCLQNYYSATLTRKRESPLRMSSLAYMTALLSALVCSCHYQDWSAEDVPATALLDGTLPSAPCTSLFSQFKPEAEEVLFQFLNGPDNSFAALHDLIVCCKQHPEGSELLGNLLQHLCYQSENFTSVLYSRVAECADDEPVTCWSILGSLICIQDKHLKWRVDNFLPSVMNKSVEPNQWAVLECLCSMARKAQLVRNQIIQNLTTDRLSAWLLCTSVGVRDKAFELIVSLYPASAQVWRVPSTNITLHHTTLTAGASAGALLLLLLSSLRRTKMHCKG